jgi:nicotinate phosphoribosyltransferase
MHVSTSFSEKNAALFTDLYQLTMLQSYFQEGMRDTAVFDLFAREQDGRNYLLACGLEDVLTFLEDLHFSDEALDYLGTLDEFEDDFLAYLSSLRFTGDVRAVSEGTPVFADEPILEVEAPLLEAQLAETYLLNQITFQTAAATKAHRLVRAADGRAVVDFGARRAHGTDAALKAARAGYVAGLTATSNVLAGRRYDLPVTGTMAHSYIEAHDDETSAFRNFTDVYPATTLLVDTYDTLSGVRKVVRLAEERGDDFQVQAVRLDSGNLGELALRARWILDDAGLEDVDIFASGSLDERKIQDLVSSGAPIDGFGVGTRLTTVADQPAQDTAYKLCGYGGTGRMKLSSGKSNLPGRKQVYRFFDDGAATRDVITTDEETLEGGQPLLRTVMRDGERTEAGRVALSGVREDCRRNVAHLPERLLSLEEAEPPYSVALSDGLEAEIERIQERLKREVVTSSE